MASGIEQSYVEDQAKVEFKNKLSRFYPNGIQINNFNNIPANVRITKLLLSSPTIPQNLQKNFNNKFMEKIYVADSGFNFTDVLPYSVNKANALKYFLRFFKIRPDQLIAFGDSMNDAEMLELAGYSYVMENANPYLKKIAKYEAPSNQNDGVFRVLKHYLS